MQRRLSEVKSVGGGGGGEIKLDIPFLSAPTPQHFVPHKYITCIAHVFRLVASFAVYRKE